MTQLAVNTKPNTTHDVRPAKLPIFHVEPLKKYFEFWKAAWCFVPYSHVRLIGVLAEQSRVEGKIRSE